MSFSGISIWAAGALIAASAGVLAVLHMLRVRPRQVRVITTLFWAEAVEKPRARSLLQRFRHPWTYALLLSICALIAIALSEPRLGGDGAEQVCAVVVLDGGMSMSAPGDGDRTRFDVGRDAVLSEAGRLSAGDRVAVIVTSPLPRLIHRFDDPRSLLSAELEELGPGTGPGLREAGLRLGESLLRGEKNRRLVLVTDRPYDDVEEAISDVDFRVELVGEPAGNAGILSAVFEPKADNPLVGRLGVRVGYWGAGESGRDVLLSVSRGGGAKLLDQRQNLLPGATADYWVENLGADGDLVEISIASGDGVAADDRAVFRLPLRRAIRVGVDDSVPAALRIAMEADAAVRIVGPDEDCDVALVGDGGNGGAGGATIAVVNNGPDAVVGSIVTAATGLGWLGVVDFAGARCGAGSLVKADAGEILLQTDGEVVAAFGSAEGSERLLLGSALFGDGSDVCHDPAFAVLVARSVRRLAGWGLEPYVLTPELANSNPAMVAEADIANNVVVMPGSRDASDVSGDHTSAAAQLADGGGWWWPGLWETALLLAFVLFVAEALLHVRGRIP